MKRIATTLLVGAALTLQACSSLTNGTSILPSQSQVPLANLGKATFAVGTARLQDGSTGLNVVAYLRQANGKTAFLVDTPSISGPTGFTVPSNSQAGVDAGTSTISASAQGSTTVTTFGVFGGLFGGGFGPFNATQTSNNFYPGQVAPGGPSPTFPTPMYGTGLGAAAPVSLVIGPPAKGITPFTNVNYPSGFAGYLPGFLAFQAAPVAGTYNLSVAVNAANAAPTTVTASATLASVTPMGAVPAPTFTKDGAGGGTVNVTVPAGATETLVFVYDVTQKVYYTVGPIAGTGAQSGSLPDNLGPCANPNCGAATLATGDNYSLTAVSFDYPDFEATQPGNTSQTPTVLGSAGQADLSISPATTGTY